MRIEDDTPEPSSLPPVYPANPPINLLRDVHLLEPRNLFVFEGIDGSGKSTVLRAVAQALTRHKIEVTTLKLAGSDLVRHALERAKWLNVDPICFSLLNWVSIFHQTSAQRNIYNTARLIFFDRYTFTVRVRGYLEGLAPDYMDILEAMVPRPTLIFMIDSDPEVCLERIRASGRPITYFESGARHVPHTHAPMCEHDNLQRSYHAEREQGLINTLERMREKYFQLLADRSDVHVIDNSGEINTTVERVLKHLLEIHISTSHRFER